ncbi:hypothetical protein Pmani_002877 [Petrolisthes manimaculis]|uniref:Uncharacterized protein n=1 Tax=Petrolisthes manimaculis TaxID=1843537 RepID=A0AAE1QH16_9EUCA|nr:hypothetical protein Pmani_002877 [Petrolisthes manimaculis]
MPSAFDLFGPFENSLRSYHNKPHFRLRPCPHGVHTPETCTCDPHHECTRPHCANDMPLDPLCRLTIGTPFGPMTSITDTTPSHKCHSNGCSSTTPTTPVKPPSAFAVAVVDRLYSTNTHASAAKMKAASGSSARSPDGGDASEDSAGGVTGGKAGLRLISQLIGDQVVGGHDRTRRDGGSPVPTRRAQSIGVRRNMVTSPTEPNPTRRSQSSHAAVKSNKRGRVSESDNSSSEMSSSPDTSPSTTPATTPTATPRKYLSPKNSGNQLLPLKTNNFNTPAKCSSPQPLAKTNGNHATPVKSNSFNKKSAKSPSGRPSAVFCGAARGQIKPTPLNKSASDGMERLRAKVGLQPVKSRPTTLLTNGQKNVLNEEVLGESLRNRVSRVSSDSRVDELLAQAYMALESLTPEQSTGGCGVVASERPTPSSSPPPPQDSLRRMALMHARKENGKSYKDLTQILQQKMEELDELVSSVSPPSHLVMSASSCLSE